MGQHPLATSPLGAGCAALLSCGMRGDQSCAGEKPSSAALCFAPGCAPSSAPTCVRSVWQHRDFAAPKTEISSQLLSPVQEKYSILCLENFLLLIIMENAACFETNSILCRLECRLFLLVYYASHVLVYRKAVHLKCIFLNTVFTTAQKQAWSTTGLTCQTKR